MIFDIQWSPVADAQFKSLQAPAEKAVGLGKKTKQFSLFKQVEGCINKLRTQGPRHPGLQTHAYTSLNNPLRPGEKVFEAYAQNNTPCAYRVFWCYGPAKGQITIVAITSHP